MVSIIAPIAEKPATSHWPPAVGIESKSLVLQIDSDARLAAAAGGAARHLADLAGIEHDAVSRLQSSVIAACLEAFEHLTADHPRLDIAFTRFNDRFEVALSHRGEGSTAVGVETIAGFVSGIAGAGSQSGVFAGFDRVQYETHGGEAVTRLTKYFGHFGPST
jgi:hypothetical protein